MGFHDASVQPMLLFSDIRRAPAPSRALATASARASARASRRGSSAPAPGSASSSSTAWSASELFAEFARPCFRDGGVVDAPLGPDGLRHALGDPFAALGLGLEGRAERDVEQETRRLPGVSSLRRRDLGHGDLALLRQRRALGYGADGRRLAGRGLDWP